MKITEITYGRTFNLTQYNSERIDLTASVDEDSESVIEAFNQLREYCVQIHKKNNPHLYSEQHTVVQEDNFTSFVHPHDKEKEQSRQDNLTPTQRIINQINLCYSIEVLKTFEFLVSKNEELKEAYNKKLNELSNGK